MLFQTFITCGIFFLMSMGSVGFFILCSKEEQVIQVWNDMIMCQ